MEISVRTWLEVDKQSRSWQINFMDYKIIDEIIYGVVFLVKRNKFLSYLALLNPKYVLNPESIRWKLIQFVNFIW